MINQSGTIISSRRKKSERSQISQSLFIHSSTTLYKCIYCYLTLGIKTKPENNARVKESAWKQVIHIPTLNFPNLESKKKVFHP